MAVELGPITNADVADVASFMTAHLNPDVPESAWVRAMAVPWAAAPPNHGFHLRDDGRVVGAYLAYYSDREIDGRSERFCNLGAWCVLEDYRFKGLQLLTKLLGQRGYHFTDFSPSGNVVPLNRRLKFSELNTTTALVPALPWPTVPGRYRVTSDAAQIERQLAGTQQRLYRDHRELAAAQHLLVTRGAESCWVVFRKDSRKGVRAFASILHVDNPALFRAAAPRIARHLAVRHGVAAVLVELRVSDGRPSRSFLLSRSRPKMYKSTTLTDHDIDYLYSELTCLDW